VIVRFHDIDIPPYGAKTMRRYNRRTTMTPKKQIAQGKRDGEYPRILVKNEDLDVNESVEMGWSHKGLHTCHHLAWLPDENATKPKRIEYFYLNKHDYPSRWNTHDDCGVCRGTGKGFTAGNAEDYERIVGSITDKMKEHRENDSKFSTRAYRIPLPNEDDDCEFCGGIGKPFDWVRVPNCSPNKQYAFPASWTFDECTQFLTDEQEREDTRRANREAAKKAKKEAEIRDAQNHNNKALIDACGMTLDEIAESNERSTFIQDVCSKGMTRKLSEKQINALANSVKKQREFKVANARYAQTATEVPAGRQEIVGTIKSVKWKENQYGGAYKMLVETDTYKVYGSVPSSIINKVPSALVEYQEPTSHLVGSTVRFTATLTPKEIGFGFFSRPSNASLE
jgi:hypothetical protein